MKSEIRPSTIEDALYISANARRPDIEELWATGLTTPRRALIGGMEFSDFTLTGLIDDVPVCMWGVVNESFIGNIGTPWMVASKDIDANARPFLRRCRAPVLEMLGKYDLLKNYVDARNVRAIQWLSWLGFTIEKPEPYGIFKLPFHPFWMARKESENV